MLMGTLELAVRTGVGESEDIATPGLLLTIGTFIDCEDVATPGLLLTAIFTELVDRELTVLSTELGEGVSWTLVGTGLDIPGRGVLETDKDSCTVDRTTCTLDVFTMDIEAVERGGATDKLDVALLSSVLSPVWGFIPLPVLGITSTGTVTPTISAIIRAMATPRTMLNMTVLLEQQRHLPGGRMF